MVRQLVVTQCTAGSSPAPTANISLKYAGVAFWLRAPLLQRGAVEFDPLPRYHFASRLWPSGFRLRSSKKKCAKRSAARIVLALEWCAPHPLPERYTLVRTQPGVSMPRSFNGRTKVFEAFYVGSIPALGAKVLLAWCTVHRRIYKLLRSRLEHGLGSTLLDDLAAPAPYAVEAHEDEQAVLTRQAVGSIPTGRTKF